MQSAEKLCELIGNTPLLKIGSLSRLSGCEIFIKCEFQNPGGSVKDRPALKMVQDAVQSGSLRPGMTIVEGTAGNTGIGLAIAAKAHGVHLLAVMPRGQTLEKERLIGLYGAELKLVEQVPFANTNHFYHTARSIAEQDPSRYWWANQFENLSNQQAHYETTGPEILQQCGGHLDFLVSVAGSGGTIGGTSRFLKEKLPNAKVILVDPLGSGLFQYFKTGAFKCEGSSITEGIGIMRLVANFKQASIDDAITLDDHHLVAISRYVRDQDGIVLGSSSALNVAAAFKVAMEKGPGSKLVTFACDLGERSYSKLYTEDFLQQKGLWPQKYNIEDLCKTYREQKCLTI